jgi:hypothetical protein
MNLDKSRSLLRLLSLKVGVNKIFENVKKFLDGLDCLSICQDWDSQSRVRWDKLRPPGLLITPNIDIG